MISQPYYFSVPVFTSSVLTQHMEMNTHNQLSMQQIHVVLLYSACHDLLPTICMPVKHE